MAENKEISEKVLTVLKVIGEVLLMLLYGLYCYANLLFRVFVPAPKKSLDGEIMLITGSSTGIGREAVLQLAKNHSRTTLVLWDWNDEENKKTASDAKKLGAKVFAYQLDVTDRLKVEETAKKVQQEVGDVTILWNNAGIARVKDLINSKPEDLEKTVQINLISHFWTLRAFLPSMIQNNHGHIVTTASLGSFFGAKYGAAYFAAKFGIRGYLESVQDELRVHPLNPNKIKFTTIFPSFIKTPLTKGVTLSVKGANEKDVWLNAENVATIIIDGIQRNLEKVIIPKGFELVILFKSLTPFAFFRAVNNKLFDGDYKED
ncbi:estradiol 17-beta-dehydrogenase 11 isoform X1 [Folsomia candida]|uniref:Short-chain dehydrogenase/reductase 3 n=2 Tax=Folsomia candida TaxID=158441 RepID=A0A226EQ25_FOLCA|nr:estradiol 17-beta-dehydrogenase 11 isoform X1 [Folsomia candida]OXA59257.1 hypothetical protein Fcan01_06008 [Folsomia candida]